MLTGHETIGELAKTGDGLKIDCRNCRKTTCSHFRLLRRNVSDDELVAFVVLRLVCKSCNRRVSDLECVSLWRIADDQPKGI